VVSGGEVSAPSALASPSSSSEPCSQETTSRGVYQEPGGEVRFGCWEPSSDARRRKRYSLLLLSKQ
jgi:hypothetical protein